MEVPAFSPAGLDSENLEKEKDWAQKIEQVEDFLEKEVDFSTIADIIGDILKKCYPEISDETVKARLEQIYKPNYKVLYGDSLNDGDIPDHKISSAQSTLKGVRFFARQFFNADKLDKVKLLSVVIHEFVHLASTTFVTIDYGFLASGVLEVKDNKLSKGLAAERNFYALNEGLTEIITDCIYSEYLARTGNLTKVDYKRFDKEGSPVDTFVTYKDQRWEVFILLDEINNTMNIPIDVAFKSLVAEYFKGEGLYREEMVKIYKNYPDLKEFIERHKRNIGARYDAEAHRYLTEELPSKERSFIHALFGRDAVGAYNSKIIENN